MSDKLLARASREAERRKAIESQPVQRDIQPEATDEWPPLVGITPNTIAHIDGMLREQALLHLQHTVGNNVVQRTVDRSRSTSIATDDLAQRVRAASISGSPLDAAVRDRLEAGLEADLSSVQIHTDDEADRLSRSVHALAFTTGQHIFFRQGEYRPDTIEGLHLIAHEATHTLQQANGAMNATSASGSISVDDSASNYEQAADRAADQVMLGSRANSQHTSRSLPWASSLQTVARQRAEAEAEEDPVLKTSGLVFNPFSIYGGEKGLEHLARFATGAAPWLKIAAGSLPIIGGAVELSQAIEGKGIDPLMRGVKGTAGGLEIVGGGASVAGTTLEAAGMTAPAWLGTVAKVAGPAGLVLGAGALGWEAGSWLRESTSAGKAAEGVWGGMDKALTAATLGEGENKSALRALIAPRNMEEAKLSLQLGPSGVGPLLLGGGLAAGGAGLFSGLLDLKMEENKRMLGLPTVPPGGTAATGWDWTKRGASMAGESVMTDWERTTGAVSDVASAIGQGTTAEWERIKRGASMVGESATTEWDRTKRGAATAWDWMTSLF